jgi:hypothetical protein
MMASCDGASETACLGLLSHMYTHPLSHIYTHTDVLAVYYHTLHRERDIMTAIRTHSKELD